MEKNGSYWHQVPAGPNPPDEVYVVVEIPRGTRNKYEIGKEFPGIKLDRIIYSSYVYPIEYGLIPQTYYTDKDPIDAMVFMSQPTFPGVILRAKPIGLMKMVDSGDIDNKMMCVCLDDPVYSNLNSYKDIPPHILDEIVNFFQTYKAMQNKKTEVTGWEDAQHAKKEIIESMEAYKKLFE